MVDLTRRRCVGVAAFALALFSPWARSAADRLDPKRTLHVGPSRAIKTLRDASEQARDGDLVLVDAGEYRADVAVWRQRGLVIRGNGGTARLFADGASAENKGIFVFRNADAVVEEIEFRGGRSSDRNGAAIRLDPGCRLSVNRCRFEDNETGILTSNDGSSELHLTDSAFVQNGLGDGYNHNIYVGAIAKLTVTGCYSARPRGAGHLLKTRARESIIAYSRLTGEDGTSSYELEFPNGGRAVVLGCLIQQGRNSENATLISYGAEGYRWEENELSISFCTIANDRPSGGAFVRVAAGAPRVELLDNLLTGPGRMDLQVAKPVVDNVQARSSDFADAPRLDLRLRRSSKLVGAAGMLGSLGKGRLRPEREYVHPASSVALEGYSAMTPLSPGAFQRLGPE
jgi:hypothetical protein